MAKAETSAEQRFGDISMTPQNLFTIRNADESDFTYLL